MRVWRTVNHKPINCDLCGSPMQHATAARDGGVLCADCAVATADEPAERGGVIRAMSGPMAVAVWLAIILAAAVVACGCASREHAAVEVQPVAPQADSLAKIAADIKATNQMVATIEADVAGIVKRQQQQVADGGAGNEGGIGIGQNGRYYGGAGLLALMWGMERFGYWLRRWQNSRTARKGFIGTSGSRPDGSAGSTGPLPAR